MQLNKVEMITIGELGIIAMQSCRELGSKAEAFIRQLRSQQNLPSQKQSYLVPIEEIRFANGEGKIKLLETVRGKDVYILCDVGNYSCTYSMYGFTNHMGPDEHFEDLKRVLSAIGGKARRITVIMPMLYASRQHKRKGRESMDCAMALQELEGMGVVEIITFDTHNTSVQNAIPLVSFENLYPTYEIVKSMLENEKDLLFDKFKMIIVSPDTGAMDRAIYYSSVLGLDIGLFYKRRDHTKLVKGKNPIIQHEYIGRDIEGQNVLIVDDMIASGESIFDILREVKKRKARKVYIAVTFALFTEGTDKFNAYYNEGLFSKVYSTNLTYIPRDVRGKEWFVEVDMSQLIGEVINSLNYDKSIADMVDATNKIKRMMAEY
jgi:ribose-phosphate pyrophosphokinase